MSWNLSNDRPIYLQLVEQIQRKILSGEYKTGERFPSVRDLARESAVNPNTMQRALQELEQSELIINNRTMGRTVTKDIRLIQQTKQELAQNCLSRFLQEMKELGFSSEELTEFLAKTKW